MHTKVSIFWDDNDPFPMGKRLEEAFNRVANFCPELRPGPEDEKKSQRSEVRVSFNRIVGGDFDIDDITRITAYSATVFTQIAERHGKSQFPQSESIMQAAQNMVDIVMHTVTYVRQNMIKFA